ncbi:uncharacterized protein LOC108811498 isoform X2 [Raphanus sativus]|uniref:Uncharacterized protein LOC108811498 isoform X2 n=1 Tax=Raphanus sativus TaxID=3726 RepID=A0A6J0JWE7_RAPSA|nr:uncharacterized protein LOC108811498 isoform X2 [Raphanus sativus]
MASTQFNYIISELRETFYSSQVVILLKGFQEQPKVVSGIPVQDGKMCFSAKAVIGKKQHFTFFNGKLLNGKPHTQRRQNNVAYGDAKKSTTTPLMEVDSSIDIVNSSSNTKEEQKRHCVLSRIYKSDPVENQTEDYALLIKQQQEMAIKDEEFWQEMRNEKEQ